ncbi:MAG TPA: putative sulfate exporter family transporter [Falsiroseomonas sp.]|jgi:uncharacterized integral membrane protein (TIGR00698 family)|nr:putative sulfate exporter family transporter [Falsiroseomonas sp.]
MRHIPHKVIGPASPARLGAILPGTIVCFGIAASAAWLRSASGIAALSPAATALLIGLALGTLSGRPAMLKPGIAFSVRLLLRAAIVLLGMQVTLGALVSDGLGVLALAAAAVALILPFTIRLGRSMGVDAALAQLIGMGTAICGASAIVAANQVVRGRDEDVTYALAAITLCGTAAMILYPALLPTTGFDARQYGIWAGASIHEVVQAAGAAAAGGGSCTVGNSGQVGAGLSARSQRRATRPRPTCSIISTALTAARPETCLSRQRHSPVNAHS